MPDTLPELTIAEHLPWVDITLDYTERLIGLTPEAMFDYRPGNAAGDFFFTPAEIAMHLADERLEFARMLDGSHSREGFWTIASWETGGDGTPWQFRQYTDGAELLASLRETRARLKPWLGLPVSALQEPTDGTRSIYERQLGELRAKGVDISGMQRRGAPSINRVLWSLVTHEAAHRSYLQTILRLQGVDARGEH